MQPSAMKYGYMRHDAVRDSEAGHQIRKPRPALPLSYVHNITSFSRQIGPVTVYPFQPRETPRNHLFSTFLFHFHGQYPSSKSGRGNYGTRAFLPCPWRRTAPLSPLIQLSHGQCAQWHPHPLPAFHIRDTTRHDTTRPWPHAAPPLAAQLVAMLCFTLFYCHWSSRFKCWASPRRWQTCCQMLFSPGTIRMVIAAKMTRYYTARQWTAHQLQLTNGFFQVRIPNTSDLFFTPLFCRKYSSSLKRGFTVSTYEDWTIFTVTDGAEDRGERGYERLPFLVRLLLSTRPKAQSTPLTVTSYL